MKHKRAFLSGLLTYRCVAMANGKHAQSVHTNFYGMLFSLLCLKAQKQHCNLLLIEAAERMQNNYGAVTKGNVW
jgi:hypothetical protein